MHDEGIPALALALLLLGGCPICPTGEMTEVGGQHGGQVRAGEVVTLHASYGDWAVGPGACGGQWSVNGLAGGSIELGTVDRCGRYQAPATLPAAITRVDVGASQFGDGCFDCCPAASTVLTFVR